MPENIPFLTEWAQQLVEVALAGGRDDEPSQGDKTSVVRSTHRSGFALAAHSM